MILKRLYDKTNPAQLVCNGVVIKSLGATERQNWSPDLIADAVAQGWMRLEGQERIVLIGTVVSREGERLGTVEVPYKVVEAPGYYCCHCEARLPGMPGVRDVALNLQRQAHVVEKHKDTPSPDPENPAGYRGVSHYGCIELEARPTKQEA